MWLMRVLTQTIFHFVFEDSVKKLKMYGQIHCIIREMVQVKFGLEKWEEVLKTSAMDEDSHFLVFSVYDDPCTFRLIDSVSRVLGIPYETVLKEFGVYFLSYCMKHGYHKMLLTLGQDLFTFIQNLDSLHSMLSLSYKGIVSPSFRCTERDDGIIVIHHYSWRNGFYPIVQGLLETVGRDLFNQVATTTFISSSQVTVDLGKVQYHTTMEHHVTMEKLACRRMAINARNSTRGGTPTCLELREMGKAFPYSIVMDNELYIHECGDAIRRLVPFNIDSDTRFPTIATIRQPIMFPIAEHIISFINSIFIIDIVHTAGQKCIPLKGQMIWLPNCCHLLFVGSPRLQTLDAFKERNMFLGDLALHDATRELVLLNQQRMAEIEKAQTQLDKTTIALKNASKDLEKEKLKTEQLVLEMIPNKIADQLYETGFVNAEKYEISSVLFSSIITFANIVSTCDADGVVNMLNDLYHRCDACADEHGVYKVETIGDAYMAVTGVPDAQVDHAARMADFAMDMLDEANFIKSPATLTSLQLKVGFHSGPLVAGVIGHKKPRYDIYGDTVNVASRMCGTSVSDRIHVTHIVVNKLLKRGYIFKNRGEVELKGKGKMSVYFLVGSQDRMFEQPEDIFTLLPDVFEPENLTKQDDSKTNKRSSSYGLLTRPGDMYNLWKRSSIISKIFNPPKFTSQISASDPAAPPPEHSQQQSTSSTPPSPAHSVSVPAPNVKMVRRSINKLRGSLSTSIPEHHLATWDLTPRIDNASIVRLPPVPGHISPSTPGDIVYHPVTNSAPPVDCPAGDLDMIAPQLFPPDSNTSCQTAASPGLSTSFEGDHPRLQYLTTTFRNAANRNDSFCQESELRFVKGSSFRQPGFSDDPPTGTPVTEACRSSLELKEPDTLIRCRDSSSADKRMTFVEDCTNCPERSPLELSNQHGELFASKKPWHEARDADLLSSVRLKSSSQQIPAVAAHSWPCYQHVRRERKVCFWKRICLPLVPRFWRNRSSSALASQRMAVTSQLLASPEKSRSESTSDVPRSQHQSGPPLVPPTSQHQLMSQTSSSSPFFPSLERDPCSHLSNPAHTSETVPRVLNSNVDLTSQPSHFTPAGKTSSYGYTDCNGGQWKRKTAGGKCSVS